MCMGLTINIKSTEDTEVVNWGSVAWWPVGGPSENFLRALKSVIANVTYYTKYVRSGLSTNSKIAGISVAIQLSNSF